MSSQNVVLQAVGRSKDGQRYLQVFDYETVPHLVLVNHQGEAISPSWPAPKGFDFERLEENNKGVTIEGDQVILPSYKLMKTPMPGSPDYRSVGVEKLYQIDMATGLQNEIGKEALPQVDLLNTTRVALRPVPTGKTYDYNDEVYTVAGATEESLTLLPDGKNHCRYVNKSTLEYVGNNGKVKWAAALENVPYDFALVDKHIVAVGRYGMRALIDKQTGAVADFSMQAAGAPYLSGIAVLGGAIVADGFQRGDSYWVSKVLDKAVTPALPKNTTCPISKAYNAALEGVIDPKLNAKQIVGTMLMLGRNKEAAQVLAAQQVYTKSPGRDQPTLYVTSEQDIGLLKKVATKRGLGVSDELVGLVAVDSKQLARTLAGVER